jgi:predicted GTPase
MLEQTRLAVHEADLVFFLIDGRQGVTPIDAHFARWLRKENAVAPVHLVANKLEGDSSRWESELNDCFQLGLGQAIPLSAEHGEGTTDLLDVILPLYDAHEKQQDEIEAAHKAEAQEEGVATDKDDDDVRLGPPKDTPGSTMDLICPFVHPHRPARSSSRSWAVRTWASRRCSTALSARTACSLAPSASPLFSLVSSFGH